MSLPILLFFRNNILVNFQAPCFILWMMSIRRMSLDHHVGFDTVRKWIFVFTFRYIYNAAFQVVTDLLLLFSFSFFHYIAVKCSHYWITNNFHYSLLVQNLLIGETEASKWASGPGQSLQSLDCLVWSLVFRLKSIMGALC